jgi:hypothetical protein
MIERRKLFVAGGASLTYSTMLGAGHAQSPFADVAGSWEGYSSENVKLRLDISAYGQFALRFLTGPAGGTIPTGRATREDGVVTLKYGDTEINLTKSADGILTGPYTSALSKGLLTFTRK